MIAPSTIEEFEHLFQKELKEHYPKEEIDTFLFLTLNDELGIGRDDIRFRKTQVLKTKVADKLHYVIAELKTEKPIQYILGSTSFFGCRLRVNEHVLIPRPETEELVELILKDAKEKKDISILDIGTGSGCIAIALKKILAGAKVSAIDISDEALLVAKANAILNQTKINFLQADILEVKEKVENKDRAFDIVVSNPPYVRLSEKAQMDKNVLEHEPHLALFVNDHDPLLFFKHIADFASRNLTPGGKLYFEINEAMGDEVKKMLEEKGFKNAEIRKDMSGKDRIALGSRQ